MVGEWVNAHLSEVAMDTDRAFAMGPFGSNIRAENYQDSGVPVIRGTNLGQPGEPRFRSDEYVYLSEAKADELASSNAHPNDIVFVAQGTVGKVGIIPTDTDHRRFVLSQNLMKVTVNPDRADPLYVFYFFRSSLGQHEILSRVNPTGVPCISKPLSSLREFSIRLPRDIFTQRAIACVLGALDDKIEINRRMNRTLEAIARAIFKSWFVDFDPVRAKAEGRDSGLPKKFEDLFPDEFEESKHGEIPKGWKLWALPELITINPPRQLSKGAVAPYLDMAGMPTIGHAPDSWIEREFGSGMKFVNGDTLVARITPCLENGKTAFIDFLEDGEVGWGSTEYIVLRPREPIPPVFAYLQARSNEFRTFAIQQMTGSSGRQRVPSDSLSKYMFAAPTANSPIFATLGRIVNSFFDRVRSAMVQCRMLSGLRDALLPKLISGELQVADAERIVGRCV